jgi:hypothetical protein
MVIKKWLWLYVYDISLFAFLNNCYVKYCYMSILYTKAIEDKMYSASSEPRCLRRMILTFLFDMSLKNTPKWII